MLTQILATLTALAIMWTAGYLVGRDRERRRGVAQQRHPSAAMIDVPDDLSTLSDHGTCDHPHDPITFLAADVLASYIADGTAAVAEGLGRTAAVFAFLPEPGSPESGQARALIEPSAYPDITNLTSAMRAAANELDAHQGEINARAAGGPR